MTVAVCIKCGAQKFGALTPCDKCDFLPYDITDRAKSIVLSDHHLDPDSLATAAKLIQSGKHYDFPPGAVSNYMVLIEREMLERQASTTENTRGRIRRVLETIHTALTIVFFMAMFVSLMVVGISLAQRFIKRPASSVMTGTIAELQTVDDADNSPFVGRPTVVYSDYITIELNSDQQIIIPREQVVHIELRP